MPDIHITVRGKVATGDDSRIVCGNSDYSIIFDFDEEWDAYDVKTARFVYAGMNGKYIDVVFSGATCTVPVLQDAIGVYVGVYAGDLHTTTPAWFECDKSILCGWGSPAAPADDVYNQIMERLNKLGTPDAEAIAAAVADYIAANPIAEKDPTVPDWAKAAAKPGYTAEEVGADPSGTAASQVSAHNTEATAHSDMRLLIQGLTDRLNALADSDDTTLDQLSEIVAYIKDNRGLIDAVTTSKVSVTDIVNDLVTNVVNKPLSAAQGVALKALVDSLSEEKVALPKDADGNPISGTAGWYAVSDGAGGITWVESAPSTGGETTHGIVWDLVNVTSSNNAVSVSDGASLVAVLSPADGYLLGDVTITMGGEVVTGAWNADTATIAISSVTGDLMISCAGVAQTGPVDTSPIIAGTGSLNDSGGISTYTSGSSYTDFYSIPEGATNVTLYLADAENVAFGGGGKLQYWNDTEQLDYWSPANKRNQEASYVIADGATRFRTSLATNGIEDSYAYDSATGYIYFAGKNTQYYGMTNINGSTSGESAVSVAAEVDNQIAMLTLTTGETVDTSAYSGLSTDYVSMVQANYDAMIAECLGDYNKIPLIVHTDQHGRIDANNQVMKLIGDMTNWYEISKCINLGDIVPDRFGTTTLENYLSATKDSIPMSKRLDVYGNHDVWDSDEDQKYTVNQKRLSPYFKNIYARRHGNNGYFTVVDDYYNVKYLVINNMEYPDTNYSTRRITTAQAKFIVSELSADDGRDIVLVSHVPFDSDDVISRDSSYSAYSEKFLSDTTAHNSFMTMLAARKNKTAGTFTDSEGVEHAYDFSGVSGDLLMSLHGHTHWEAYRTFENSITEFAFDWFDGNTFYFAYIDRQNKKFKVWKNEADVEALEISIA